MVVHLYGFRAGMMNVPRFLGEANAKIRLNMYTKDYSYGCSEYKTVEGYYVEACDWLRVMDLLRAELRFLRKVLVMFRRSAGSTVSGWLESIHAALKRLEMKRRVLEVQTAGHRLLLDIRLKEMICRGNRAPSESLTEEHERLCSVFRILNRELRMLKKKLFAISESELEGGD